MFKSNNIVKFVQVANAAKVGYENMQEIEQIIKQANSRLQEINDWCNELLQSNQCQYGKLWSSLKSYLEAEGKIVPVDEMEFFAWFLDVRYPNLQIGEPLPTVGRPDFALFHQYHERKMKDAIEIAPITLTVQGLSLKTAALLHFYLSKNGGKAVTMHNRDKLACNYGHTSKSSGKHLYDYFQEYQRETERLAINHDNIISARTHLKRFFDILPLLESQNEQGFNHAKRDCEKVNKKISNPD